MYYWLSNNYLEVFGAVTGIIYVFLEIRQKLWLWPLGIITSGVYVWVFFTGKLYADMSLQGYYLVISFLGWYWWAKGVMKKTGSDGRREENKMVLIEEGKNSTSIHGEESRKLKVTRLKTKTGFILLITFIILYFVMWLALSRLTDSPVPEWDSFLTSMSIIATWMLARKIYEHWFVWIVVNMLSIILYYSREFYPTVVLYFVYAVMSFVGLAAWGKTIRINQISES